MNLYRSLLWWLALAALGALGWSWFAQDLGDVVIRFRGLTYTTTLAYLVVAWALLWFLLWVLWWLLQLPLRAWRRHVRQLARNRLASGLEALHQGRWQRAESLLAKAADEDELRTPALLGARRAAIANGDAEAAARHQAALLGHDPQAAALEQATSLASQQRHEDVLTVLAGMTGTLPPRAAMLQAEALVAVGRARDAQALLASLRQELALPATELDALEQRLTAAALTQSAEAELLFQRWQALPPRLQHSTEPAAAFARRGLALGLESHAVQALGDAIDAQWNEALVALYGQLPAQRDTARLERAETWMAEHGHSPALLVTLGQLSFQQQLWGKAEDYLHRALAQGAGADGWEWLGHVWTAQNDNTRAPLAYANALRVSRGEEPLSLAGRTLREQIADQAVAEQRNEHGIPLIPR